MKWLALLLVGISSPALADDVKDHADAVYKNGEQLYAAKDYLGAAKKFEESYSLDPDPGVLFDIGQAYRLGRACAQAAHYYHEFVRRVPDPPEKEKLEHYITDMDACAKAEAALSPPTVVHDTKIVHDTEVVHVRDPAPDRSHVAPIVVGSAGLVAMGLAVYFTYDVRQIQRQREALCNPMCNWPDVAPTAAHLDDRGQRAEIGEAVFYAAGGAALITAAALFIHNPQDTGERVVTAAPSRGGGTVLVGWRF